MERLKEPNKGLISPPGGKLKTEIAESPSACAAREANEECGIVSSADDWKLKGIVTEKNYPSIGNIMIFLTEFRHSIDNLPHPCNEGEFHFIHPDNFHECKMPLTDKLFLWKKILKNSPEPFLISIDCSDYPKLSLI